MVYSIIKEVTFNYTFSFHRLILSYFDWFFCYWLSNWNQFKNNYKLKTLKLSLTYSKKEKMFMTFAWMEWLKQYLLNILPLN